ncbi:MULTISPECIES: exodeoxyribonuclease VII small subunit [Malaciobacter]|jgi:exodeoxyribonuclease VII small subunit|uniref:Exodeoxyribonuclease VII small subunit n=2 Tax=Malaciobacter TaxID=2321114 RepID=A0A1T5A2J1_9BACT|nr:MULTISPECIES: exodeoxyribonuclease VII small subunit [Malaciobacter]AXX86915.1 exodeoxyribonuclease VII, small subunit [Malaciobacter marinus]PHO10210.1 exonuclease VII small subunit [Malaciobacter canalis]PHO15871.1 exonuclease VII small subunit [Malaciobacter marinus]PPK59860.1 exodeoxyribonuclease VII small subunit [Malaciobacter marinus]QEE32700.1 exodeoxyribonuclease VII, small subunit [Malaciobacter canalis]
MNEEKQEEKLAFEEKILKAKELLEKLNSQDITLQNSIEVYKSGVKELEEAQKLLDEAKLIFTTKEKDNN